MLREFFQAKLDKYWTSKFSNQEGMIADLFYFIISQYTKKIKKIEEDSIRR